MTIGKPCECMECRVRAAIFGHALGEGGGVSPIDTAEALTALGHVISELLAHHSDDVASQYLAKLAELREAWKQHPRVVIQNTMGNG
ncbi:hypothetical protein [Bradyrhizobium paxllaeri]|uniref:hypothetical protein n=1 Tax=Bradyrhizobium paxllaeri TaxID=190148 RepID=UPI00114675A3|nr:hypothetical protein [Bradyrhizobium paxllaeri]